MLYMSHLFSAASGKLSGLVASRNRGGPYVRAHVVPIDPMTTEQLNCRTAMTDLASAWSTTLTATQRSQWAQLAAANPLPNRLGIERIITGRALFFRQNFVRRQAAVQLSAGSPTVATPPSSLSRPLGPLVTPTWNDQSSGQVVFTWAGTPDWNAEAGTFFLIYVSNVSPGTRNRYFGPWTLTYALSAEDWSSPQYIGVTGGDPIATGEKLFFRFVVTFNNGQLSEDNFASLTGA